jgi:hypothetical protein
MKARKLTEILRKEDIEGAHDVKNIDEKFIENKARLILNEIHNLHQNRDWLYKATMDQAYIPLALGLHLFFQKNSFNQANPQIKNIITYMIQTIMLSKEIDDNPYPLNPLGESKKSLGIKYTSTLDPAQEKIQSILEENTLEDKMSEHITIIYATYCFAIHKSVSFGESLENMIEPLIKKNLPKERIKNGHKLEALIKKLNSASKGIDHKSESKVDTSRELTSLIAKIKIDTKLPALISDEENSGLEKKPSSKFSNIDFKTGDRVPRTDKKSRNDDILIKPEKSRTWRDSPIVRIFKCGTRPQEDKQKNKPKKLISQILMDNNFMDGIRRQTDSARKMYKTNNHVSSCCLVNLFFKWRGPGRQAGRNRADSLVNQITEYNQQNNLQSLINCIHFLKEYLTQETYLYWGYQHNVGKSNTSYHHYLLRYLRGYLKANNEISAILFGETESNFLRSSRIHDDDSTFLKMLIPKLNELHTQLTTEYNTRATAVMGRQ